MTRGEYNTLKKMGMLWEFYPKATENYDRDVEAGIIDPDNLDPEFM